MKITFETDYNQKALSVMAGCLRKTVRKARSKRSHVFGWIVIALALVLAFSSEGLSINKVVTILAALVIFIALIFENRINGYFAMRRMLPGTQKAVSAFDTENQETFVSETDVGKSEFSYDKIGLIVETDRYFVFVFSSSHAQIYDKLSLSGATAEEFRKFIQEATGKAVIAVK